MAVKDHLGERLATFCALMPIADSAGLSQALAALPGGAASPFARLPATHFARFVVVPELRREVVDQPPDELGAPYLMFSAFFDSEPDAYLAALCDDMGDEADAVWRHCRDYPGHPSAKGATFRAWLTGHRVPATQIFGAYPDASIAEIHAALDFRKRFLAFAFGREAQRDGQAAVAAFAADAGAL